MSKSKETLVSIFERRISTRILFEVSKDERPSSFISFRQYVSSLRLLRTFAGVLGEKIRMRVILKENTANYISLESLINVDFGKNINCRFLQFCKIKSQSTAKMTTCHSIELIGYQMQAHWQNNCTALIAKDQSSKACQHFSIFWLVIF